jgi:cytochrome c oxidase subunit II
MFNGCGDPKLNALRPSGSVGEKQLNLIMWSFYLMVGVFTVVMTIYIYVLIRFRKRKDTDGMPKQVHGNLFLELIWTVIPIVLLAVLAMPTVKYTFELAEPKQSDNAVFVRVTGHQYWWEFEYPHLGIKTAQELHIPIGQKVHLELHGKDVLHSFWVPALGGKTDVIPGRVNTMWLDAKKPGVYHGKCAELCGAGHALMDFKVYADKDFSRWVSQMQHPSRKVSTSSMKKGEWLFKQNCMGCHAGTSSTIPGPDLNKFGTRKTIAGVLPSNEMNLKKWLKNPVVIKPGAKMPKIDYLNQDEMNSLIQYLMDRK